MTDSAISTEIACLDAARAEIGKILVGQTLLVDRLLLALLCNGHVLLEGVPGLGKTLTITTLAQVMRVSFRRIQFTPDLLPADLIGTLVFEPSSGSFETRKGPIFANLILADEINRAPAKVQSALLEAMQERQVTIGGRSYGLEDPFLVMATQNPIEQEGTYPLPEAQVDRFMLKLKVTYPEREDELLILRRMARSAPPREAAPVLGPADILRLRHLVDEVHMEARLEEYIVSLVDATRRPGRYRLGIGEWIRYGASTRASIFLALASKAAALMAGRAFVLPEDIKSVALDILRHRVITSYEAEAQQKTPEDLVEQVLAGVPAP